MIDDFRKEYGFLSNFFVAPFTTPRGTLVQTVEHAFQACKTLDRERQLAIIAVPSPRAARSMGGSKTKTILRADWLTLRLRIMRTLVYEKFIQNDRLYGKLIATGDQTLIEGNTWHDNFWGNCVCRRCQGTVGCNHLGHILMRVREKLLPVNRDPFK